MITHRAAGLDDLEESHIDRSPPDGLDEGERDVAAVEHRDRQQIEEGQVDVEHHAEPERQPPAFGSGRHVVDAHHHHRPAHVLELYVALGRRDRADGIDDGHHAGADLLDGIGMADVNLPNASSMIPNSSSHGSPMRGLVSPIGHLRSDGYIAESFFPWTVKTIG